ncbi:hypothetical protein MNB_SV-6-1029 [hydrothermal vent metagenome]|uniref:Lipoprotein n=1 Tax=hydrothermal vent metagenome TaxID=652676 RepID=A0A1W1C7V3_9ZZZZ
MKSRVIIAIGSALILLLGGCASSNTASNGLLIRHLNKSYLPDVQKDAQYDKKTFELGRSCLSRAKTVQEANTCNDKVRKRQPDIGIEDFKKWDEEERSKVLKIIDVNEKFVDCLIAAKHIEMALECKEP